MRTRIGSYRAPRLSQLSKLRKRLGTRIPLLREGGVAAPSKKWSRSLVGADGVVVSSHGLLIPNGLISGGLKQPPRPLHKGLLRSNFFRSRPPLLREGGVYACLKYHHANDTW